MVNPYFFVGIMSQTTHHSRFGLLTCWFLWSFQSWALAVEIDRNHENSRASINTILGVEVVPAFAHLTFKRPIVLTSAHDGSGRVFIASQLGTIRVFENDHSIRETKLFLDIRDQVVYKDKENEEGFLGLAFHPQYEQNGQLFVYYTTRDAPHTSVISRFHVSADNPNRADPSSEEELLRILQPYWNHNGGTLEFGPDGYLYIALGDGGLANDPHNNGQNLGTLLGKILRLDVDRHDGSLPYAIPPDNPFRGQPEARGEIWAYGLRNVWRFSFDSKTGHCWAADVGQDTWEEIDLIERGGNYGWNLREGRHQFPIAQTDKGSGPRPDLIEPILEYHHDVGKSITGGCVYRGQQIPQLEGLYLYADYVTGQIWALDYDFQRKQVVANHPIPGNIIPVMSFGQDAKKEVYFLTTDGLIHRFRSSP